MLWRKSQPSVLWCFRVFDIIHHPHPFITFLLDFMKSYRLLCVACVLLLMRLPAHGCSCFGPPSVQDEFNYAAKVFACIVVSFTTDSSPLKPSIITVQVIKAWKGTTTGSLMHLQYGSSAGCNYTELMLRSVYGTSGVVTGYTIDTRPHVLFMRQDGFVFIPGCSNSQPLNGIIDRQLDGVLTAINERDHTQIYISPNPSTDQTTLSFSLAKPAVVSLELYNALGERVLAIPSELKAAGTHREPIDVRALPAGVYFCRIRTDDEEMTMHRILVAR
jgi:hypothetical protein